jgi:hypothetical protein
MVCLRRADIQPGQINPTLTVARYSNPISIGETKR